MRNSDRVKCLLRCVSKSLVSCNSLLNSFDTYPIAQRAAEGLPGNGMSASSCMCACDDRPDRQAGLSVEEGSHALHLPIEVAALFGSELLKRLHGDIKPATRAPLMPDSSDGSIDEEHRVVSRLPARGQRALCGPPGK